MLLSTPAVHRGGLTHRVCGHCHKDVHVLPGITDAHFISGLSCADEWNTGGGMEYFESKYEWCPECHNFGETILADNLAEYNAAPDLAPIIASDKPIIEKIMLVMHKLQPRDFTRLRDVYWYYMTARDFRNARAWRQILLASLPKPEKCSLDMLLLTIHLYRLDERFDEACELECFVPRKDGSLTVYATQLRQKCLEEIELCRQHNTNRFAQIEHKVQEAPLSAPTLQFLEPIRPSHATMTCHRCGHRQQPKSIDCAQEQKLGEYVDGFIHGWELLYFELKYETCEKCHNVGCSLSNMEQLVNNDKLKFIDKKEMTELEYIYRSMYQLKPCKETLRDLYWFTDLRDHPDMSLYRSKLIEKLEESCRGFEELRLLADCYRRSGNFKKAKSLVKHPRLHAGFTPSKKEKAALQFLATLCDSKITQRVLMSEEALKTKN